MTAATAKTARLCLAPLFVALALADMGRSEDPDRASGTPRWLRDVLPKGAKLCYVERTTSGRTYLDGTDAPEIVSRQPATYEADLDGDGKTETVVVYWEKQVWRGVGVAILASGDRPEQKTLAGKFTVNMYLQSAGGKVSIWFADFDKDGKTEAYFLGAMSASCGSRLYAVFHSGGETEKPYQIKAANVGISHIHRIKHGFKAAWKTDARWTIIKIKRDSKGSLRFQVDPSGPARDAASPAASGKGQSP